MNMTIDLISECALSDSDIGSLRSLLDTSFPETFEQRIYFKQLPHYRLLARDGGRLVGQVGLDFRVIRIDQQVFPILGIIDLCVRADVRHRGYGTQILARARDVAMSARADFVLAMADHHELYLKNGYQNIRPAHTRWLAIEERESVMIIERDLSACFMAQPISARPWPTGKIDLLGYLF